MMFKKAALCLFLICMTSGIFMTPAAAANPRPVIIDSE
jgi:hypothetical protein